MTEGRVNETYHPRGLRVHGYLVKDHPCYEVWSSMKARCSNPNSTGYENYAGRGITYDPDWKHFVNFAEDMGLPPFEGATLDRINNDGNYTKANCRWVDRTEQCLNRRTFKNNTSGERGVVEVGDGRFQAKYDAYGVRYNLGRFSTVEEATAARGMFIELLETNPDKAMEMCERRARYDSTTQIKGIGVHPEGGFMVRYTLSGERIYLGLYQRIEAAEYRLRSFEDMLGRDKANAMKTIRSEARSNSKTGVRGINPSPNGGLIVRCNVDGKRVFVGSYKTLEEAVKAKERFEFANEAC